MNEEWRPIKGYEGIYEVSSFGRVRSLEHKARHRSRSGKEFMVTYKGRILSPYVNPKGYHFVLLNNVSQRVHRLVAEAFIPNPDNLPQVNHKDENPANNRADNLEWCTQAYNLRYGTAIMRMRDSSLKRANAVLQLDMDGNVLARHLSLERAAQAVGCATQLIKRVCDNKPHCHTAKGFKWKWADK